MPIDILLDKTTRTLRTHASGEVTIEDFIDSMEKTFQLIDSGVIEMDWGQIIDLTDVSNVEELKESDIALIASKSPWPAGARRAIVVTEDRALQLARVYQSMGSSRGHQIRIVESIEEARDWVGSKAADTAS